ncbi:MAG: ATP-binding protein [Propionibacteriaceae bacterium]|jgi:predicted AAA+ superfamily ATPase|nr:ATP-binding protein [Propionibacteriaceae bacterium]
MEVKRSSNIDFLRRAQDTDFIKVITGARRCGKSTLLRQFQTALVESGVAPEQIISINLEELEFREIATYLDLYDHIVSRLKPDAMNYVFIDEVQMIDSFEKAVDSLYVKDNVDIYVTGSNSKMLSSEIATLLTGRYIECKVLPLSFAEYMQLHVDENPQQVFLEYAEFGGFPGVAVQQDELISDRVLESIFNSSIIKDVLDKMPNIDQRKLHQVVEFVFNNVGNITSPNKIANAMTSRGESISNHSVSAYLALLEDNFTLYPASQYDIRGTQLLETQQKFYLVDVGLRRVTTSRDPFQDRGHALENIVYLELLRRFPKVWIGKIDNNEVDFMVTDRDRNTQYYQVALTALDETTLARELKPLQRINDAFPRWLITSDNIRTTNYDGIRHINVVDWLLDGSQPSG